MLSLDSIPNVVEVLINGVWTPAILSQLEFGDIFRRIDGKADGYGVSVFSFSETEVKADPVLRVDETSAIYVFSKDDTWILLEPTTAWRIPSNRGIREVCAGGSSVTHRFRCAVVIPASRNPSVPDIPDTLRYEPAARVRP